MDLNFKLSQQQSQKLILSPQIQQYLKLLQQPLIELLHTIDQELTENPVLEETTTTQETNDHNEAQPEVIIKNESRDELDFQQQIDLLDKLDDQFSEVYHASQGSQHTSLEDLEKKQNFKESLMTQALTITDYIEWQFSFLDLSPEEEKIAHEITGNISEDGYFRLDPQEIGTACEVPAEKVLEVLTLLQTLDPAGIFGRDLREVLMLQMERKEATPTHKLAYKILDEQFPLFKKRDYSGIARAMSVPVENIENPIKAISILEPKPGRIFYTDENLNIVPDATIYAADYSDSPEYTIEIHDEAIPSLRISRYYKTLLQNKNIDKTTKEYIKQKINSGIWFMKAIEQRKSTLRLITEQIVIEQEEFFAKGFAFLKPLTLKDIADKVNIHESTVSRALSQKYVTTPQGTIPFKSFFSNKMPAQDGEFESQKSVMERLKKLIEAENPKRPLSDAKLVQLIEDDGITIARRTVAKYRDMLKILPSHLRKSK